MIKFTATFSKLNALLQKTQMYKLHLATVNQNTHSLFLKPIFHSNRKKYSTICRNLQQPNHYSLSRCHNIACAPVIDTGTFNNSVSSVPTSVVVKAVVTVELTVESFLLKSLGVLGGAIFLELVSSDLDPKMGLEKDTIGVHLRNVSNDGDEIKYDGILVIPHDFGEIAGVLVTNEHAKEVFIKDVVLMIGDAPLTMKCNSWVHSKRDSPQKRIFFAKTCLPSQTQKGLQRLRKKELKKDARIKALRWRGQYLGVRNGLIQGVAEPGDQELKRAFDTNPLSETRSDYVYVPRDQALPEVRKMTISAKTMNFLLDIFFPSMGAGLVDATLKFINFVSRDSMSKKGIFSLELMKAIAHGCCREKQDPRTNPLSETRSDYVYVPRDQALPEVRKMTISAKTMNFLLDIFFPSMGAGLVDATLKFINFVSRDSMSKKGIFSLELMKAIAHGCCREKQDPRTRDKLAWCRDEEFSRHTLAGLNPSSIQLVMELPLMSKESPDCYGPPESLITEELVEREINDFMTAKEALEEKRLFMLDYHDLLLPYVHKVRELEGTTLYGSRSIFFLTDYGTLRPIAIELTRPKSPTMPQWKRVFTPSWDAEGAWLWKLAKAHVCAHDSGHHQLISHWLRAHCCTEPYIIAANRQLSAMHPIYKLLHPHFRLTLEVNAVARKTLINTGGLIESCFAPRKYSMELSSAYYNKYWRFDMEALPADLIRRGMVVEDPKAEHGLRLTIKDYPFANDGLLIWFAIQDWVTAYVNHYYPNCTSISTDDELQGFWTEVRTQGHADKKDEPWWPKLETPSDLIQILTTIIWTTSAYHASVNFGHYHFSGLIPHRPTIARTTMPVEGEASYLELTRFWEAPENAMLECFPSAMQTTQVVACMDVLSSHASDEEYLGLKDEDWEGEDLVIRKAYDRFHDRLREIERIIDEKNRDKSLKNRCGPGIVPYELLKPFSNPGVTGMGIPNSVSI